MRHVQNDQLFVFGYQPEFLERLGSQYAQSPMAAADIVASVGDVNILSTDRQELLESRFYREVLQPFGLTDMIWFPALRTGGRMASMHASRKDKAPHYQQLEIGLFKLLVAACLSRADDFGCARYPDAALGDAGKDARCPRRGRFPHGPRRPGRLHE